MKQQLGIMAVAWESGRPARSGLSRPAPKTTSELEFSASLRRKERTFLPHMRENWTYSGRLKLIRGSGFGTMCGEAVPGKARGDRSPPQPNEAMKTAAPWESD